MSKKFPTLYTKTATGAIQFWEIAAGAVCNIDCGAPKHYPAGYIKTTWGQLGTDRPQTTEDIVRKGTNEGKKNERTPQQQAEFEAEALWKKQKKSGYVETKEAAENNEVDALIEGGIEPMLAHSYGDLIQDLRTGEARFEKTGDAKKLGFPVFVQPKLDGIRCIAVLKGGKATLWTRTRKPITSCPHVAAEVERVFAGSGDVVVDGELYNHDLKADFEKIVSSVRKQEPTDECARLVQYHVYDVADTAMSYASRKAYLSGFEASAVVRFVETHEADDDAQVADLFAGYREQGYEGAILRKADGRYENKRSYGLQKFKDFQDDEFEIVGATEGRGKLAGKLGTWVCVTNERSPKGPGIEFETAMNGEQSTLEAFWRDRAKYVGKLLTVRYQGYTGAEGRPRIPKGHSVRDYE